MNREEGYYWVKGLTYWKVALYISSSNKWVLPGIEKTYKESHFTEIGPKIEPPPSKHICKFELLRTIDDEKVCFRRCNCGKTLFPPNTTQEEKEHVFKAMRKPGAIFEKMEVDSIVLWTE